MKDNYEITSDQDVFVEVVGSKSECKIHSHATNTEAAAILGAMSGAVIESYFKAAKRANVPKQVAIKPLTRTLIETFKACGVDVVIDYKVQG